jgi:hypothetical protein
MGTYGNVHWMHKLLIKKMQKNKLMLKMDYIKAKSEPLNHSPNTYNI